MQYESLKPEDVKIIESIQRRICSTVEVLTSDLQYLIDCLNNYKEQTDNMISASLDEANILVKYHGDGQSSLSYNLPGTFASTTASFDLATMRGDNQKLKVAQDKHESSDNQRTSTYSMISGTYNEIRSRLNLLANDNQEITQRLDDLKESNNLESFIDGN